MTKKKIAVFYPAFMGGGAEAVGLWILEALKETYDLTLVTVADVDFDKLNAMYGTTLSPENVKVEALVSSFFRPISHFLIANNSNLRMQFFHVLMRKFKAKVDQYDLVLSGYSAMDLGRKGIQYIHWVNVLEGKPFHRKISNFNQEQLKENFSISNSYFVADRVKEVYGIPSIVIYPPVLIDVPEISWEQKENAFICSGRLTEAKQPHKVIRILETVRKQGFDVKLYMTGGGGGVYAWKYQRFLNQMIKKNESWVTLYSDLKYKDYVDVVAKCRYGLHFKQEPFGISIAEMVKGGAIPFVRNFGGQIEIVGQHNEDLFFTNEKDAAEKIVAVLSDPDKQHKLLASLKEQQKLFSAPTFMREIREVVANHFS